MKHAHTHTQVEDAYCIEYTKGGDRVRSPLFHTVEDALYHLYRYVDEWSTATVKRLVGEGHRAIQGGYYPRHYGHMDMKAMARRMHIA